MDRKINMMVANPLDSYKTKFGICPWFYRVNKVVAGLYFGITQARKVKSRVTQHSHPVDLCCRPPPPTSIVSGRYLI